jgi:hypothetical protein
VCQMLTKSAYEPARTSSGISMAKRGSSGMGSTLAGCSVRTRGAPALDEQGEAEAT